MPSRPRIGIAYHKNLRNTTTDRGYNASDHNTIRFEIRHEANEPRKIRPWNKAKWDVFALELAAVDYKIPEVISMKKLDKLVDRTYNAINTALDLACPMITVNDAVKPSHWANEKHLEAKDKVSKLYRRAKESKKPEDWNDYKCADKEFKRMCKTDKNQAWRKYKESLETTKEVANLVKLAQRAERHDINVLTKEDDTATDPGKETIELLTKTHFKSATDTLHVTYNNRRNCPSAALHNKYSGWINTHKIREALDGFEKKKSPGPDELKPLIFEHLPDQFVKILEFIYKAAIHLAYTPKA